MHGGGPHQSPAGPTRDMTGLRTARTDVLSCPLPPLNAELEVLKDVNCCCQRRCAVMRVSDRSLHTPRLECTVSVLSFWDLASAPSRGGGAILIGVRLRAAARRSVEMTGQHRTGEHGGQLLTLSKEASPALPRAHMLIHERPPTLRMHRRRSGVCW